MPLKLVFYATATFLEPYITLGFMVMRLSINKVSDMLVIFHLLVIFWFVMIACLCLLANDLGVQGK